MTKNYALLVAFFFLTKVFVTLFRIKAMGLIPLVMWTLSRHNLLHIKELWTFKGEHFAPYSLEDWTLLEPK